MELELAILSKNHDTKTVEEIQTPICLTEHIELANSKLDTPYTQIEIKKFTQNILRFMHDMTKHRCLDELNSCKDLIDFLDTIPEPEELMYY